MKKLFVMITIILLSHSQAFADLYESDYQPEEVLRYSLSLDMESLTGHIIFDRNRCELNNDGTIKWCTVVGYPSIKIELAEKLSTPWGNLYSLEATNIDFDLSNYRLGIAADGLLFIEDFENKKTVPLKLVTDLLQ